MSPKTKDKYVGIEIECFSEESWDNVEKMVKEMELGNLVELDNDGSIRCNCPIQYRTINNPLSSEHGRAVETRCPKCRDFELKVLCKETDLRSSLIKVGKLLRKMKAQVNDSCGLHVHLDMRSRSLMQSADRLFNIQDILYKSIPKKRRESHFCRKVDSYSLMDTAHYHGINTQSAYERHQTLEVRMHEGTVDIVEIYNWVKFLINAVESSISMPTKQTTIFPLRLKKYIDTRIKQHVRS